MRLLNEVVIVTGATGGIGDAQCRLFARERAVSYTHLTLPTSDLV